jgi:hypothetical protein
MHSTFGYVTQYTSDCALLLTYLLRLYAFFDRLIYSGGGGAHTYMREGVYLYNQRFTVQSSFWYNPSWANMYFLILSDNYFGHTCNEYIGRGWCVNHTD